MATPFAVHVVADSDLSFATNTDRPGPPSSFLKTRAGSRRGSQKGLEKPTRPRARAEEAKNRITRTTS